MAEWTGRWELEAPYVFVGDGHVPFLPFLDGWIGVEIPACVGSLPVAVGDELELCSGPLFEGGGVVKGWVVRDLEDAKVLGRVRLDGRDMEPFSYVLGFLGVGNDSPGPVFEGGDVWEFLCKEDLQVGECRCRNIWGIVAHAQEPVNDRVDAELG